MMRQCSQFVFLVVASLTLAAQCQSQDFRVYTSVTQVGADGVSRNVVARSLTLFHAGKVYDHMEDVGELVIFEPVQDRFLLIREHLGTEVSLDELRTMLTAAEKAAEEYAAGLQKLPEPDAVKARAQLLFQLHPRFAVQYDAESRSLDLSGEEFSYHVRGAAVTDPELLKAYANYADWTARLNTVLHSQGSFPGPREALNQALLTNRVLPVSVTLQANDPRDLHLQANHEFRWQLLPIDRELIHQWEQLRQSDRMRWVSFREYQHKLLAAAKSGNR